LYSGGPADEIVLLYNTAGNRFRLNAGGPAREGSPGEIMGEISGAVPRVDELVMVEKRSWCE